MKSVIFLKTVTGGDGEILKEGETFSLNDASADRWIKRGIAAIAETRRNIVGKSAPAQEDEKPKADSPKEKEPESKPEPEIKPDSKPEPKPDTKHHDSRKK